MFPNEIWPSKRSDDHEKQCHTLRHWMAIYFTNNLVHKGRIYLKQFLRGPAKMHTNRHTHTIAIGNEQHVTFCLNIKRMILIISINFQLALLVVGERIKANEVRWRTLKLRLQLRRWDVGRNLSGEQIRRTSALLVEQHQLLVFCCNRACQRSSQTSVKSLFN